MRLVATSDLHGFLPSDAEMPEGDLLVIAGDIMPMNHSFNKQLLFLGEFDRWLQKQNKKYTHGIIGIGGNHDFLFDPKSAGKMFLDQYFYPIAGSNYARGEMSWEYLENQFSREHKGEPIIYGTPYVPNLRNWAFYSPEEESVERFNRVPYADVVISHGPPYGLCDTTREGDIVGSGAFKDWIVENQPKVVICGHIHEGYGVDVMPDSDTTIYNVSYVDRDYVPGNPPMVIDV